MTRREAAHRHGVGFFESAMPRALRRTCAGVARLWVERTRAVERTRGSYDDSFAALDSLTMDARRRTRGFRAPSRGQQRAPPRPSWCLLLVAVLASCVRPVSPHGARRGLGDKTAAAMPSFAPSGAGAIVTVHGLNFAPGGARGHLASPPSRPPRPRSSASSRNGRLTPLPLPLAAQAPNANTAPARATRPCADSTTTTPTPCRTPTPSPSAVRWRRDPACSGSPRSP